MHEIAALSVQTGQRVSIISVTDFDCVSLGASAFVQFLHRKQP